MYNIRSLKRSLTKQIFIKINVSKAKNTIFSEPIALHLSADTGVLPARSRSNIVISAKPHRRVVYSWALYYDLINENGNVLT